jgi:hypothetical protein
MRNITNRIATDGFCALGAGTADYWPVSEDRVRSEIPPCIDESRAYRQLNSCNRVVASTPAAVFDKQSSAAWAAALQLSVPCES